MKFESAKYCIIYLLASFTLCFAQEPDYSEETILKLKPLYESAVAADKKNDHKEAFGIYLKMWNISHIPDTRSMAVLQCFESIDFSKIEKGQSLSESLFTMCKKCPEPILNSRNDMMTEHLCFCLIQISLAVTYNNATDFDSTTYALSLSEVHLEAAEKYNSTVTDKALFNQIKRMLPDLRETVIHNKGVENYHRVLGNIRTTFRASKTSLPSEKSSDTKQITNLKKNILQAKNFTVTSDARANQTGDEAGSRGDSFITIRDEKSTFLLRYYYDFPSCYLISAGRDKSLKGKIVTIQFDGEKAIYVSCVSGNGNCKIKSIDELKKP